MTCCTLHVMPPFFLLSHLIISAWFQVVSRTQPEIKHSDRVKDQPQTLWCVPARVLFADVLGAVGSGPPGHSHLGSNRVIASVLALTPGMTTVGGGGC